MQRVLSRVVTVGCSVVCVHGASKTKRKVRKNLETDRKRTEWL